jgi:tetratricopeptide (TPR) repeat protein
MSKTLNLVDMLLARGRNFQALGRPQDALQIFTRLAGLREIPGEIAEEAQARLAEIHYRYDNLSRARRHLAAALAYQPNNAHYHHLMANALDLDDEADPEQAYKHYRRSLELEPEQPACLGEFGLLALSLGKEEEGLEALRRAVELALDDPETVGNLVEGLLELDDSEEARRVLQAALFRNPRHPGFRKLWSDFQFHQAREAQEAARRSHAVCAAAPDGPVLLPFVRLVASSGPKSPARKRFRVDGPTAPKPPHPARPTPFSDRKHA